MNREIKFRGYSHELKEWVYGNFLNKENVNIEEDMLCCSFIQDENIRIHEVDQNSIGQFTGRKDSRGQDIYEGDILIDLNNNSQCYVDFVNGCWYRKPFDDSFKHDILLNDSTMTARLDNLFIVNTLFDSI